MKSIPRHFLKPGNSILHLFLLLTPFLGISQKQLIFTEDISNFWNAYDHIVQEKDTIRQLNLINTLYIDKGTPGLEGIMKARRYSAAEYVYAINHYREFWKSVRPNTLKAFTFSNEIQQAIDRLRWLYPNLKPAPVYFTIGLLRTGGTTMDNMVLIGSEVALTDPSVKTAEFDAQYPHLSNYFKSAPINDVVFLNTHEYIHTQQQTTIGNTLLAQTVIEGVAEFLAEEALGKKSPNPQIAYGFSHEMQVKQEFVKEMFSPNIYNWIMNDTDNPFGMRDMGYFVGYAICKKYYDLSKNKKEAVKNMITLYYNNEEALIDFVEKSQYFESPLLSYKSEFEVKRPKVTGIIGLENQDAGVDPATRSFTILFSKPMNPEYRNFEYGPLGESNVLRITKVIGFSADNRSFTFEAAMEHGKQYQLVVNSGFTSQDGFPLVPYLIDFKTMQ